MKGSAILLDTNIWVYLLGQSSPEKSAKAQKIVNDSFESIMISTQILGELYNVLTQKKLNPKDEAKQIILEMVKIFTIVEIDTLKVMTALEINVNYG